MVAGFLEFGVVHKTWRLGTMYTQFREDLHQFVAVNNVEGHGGT